jgi:hypothetical protein
MTDLVQPGFEPWTNFYVIIGSSAGALTGLQFVVISLVAERRKISNTADIAAFGTPIIVHFCVVLFLAAILSAPWQSLGSAATVLGLTGALALIYTMIVARRAGRGEYKPVLDDRIWHNILPSIAYLLIIVGAALLPRGAGWVMFALAAAALMLLFIGIRNAWDTVLYVMTMDA